MPTPYRDRTSGVFKVRVDVPPDLIAVVGKKELRRTLGVRDARDVTRLNRSSVETGGIILFSRTQHHPD
jgi:hypothetical protein